MSPAFSSARQAGAFALLLLGILLLPMLAGKSCLPPREQIYSSVPLLRGPYPYLHQQIFEEKGDIDIAFVGSSLMWVGIDAPYVQKELSATLGRNAEVRSLGWVFSGCDALYFIARDLLQNRKIRLLVIYDEDPGPDSPHSMSTRLFRFREHADALTGLPAKARAAYYFGAILGMPRNLLSLIRPNLGPDQSPAIQNYWETRYHTPDIPSRLGSVSAQRGFNDDWPNPTFTEYTPRLTAQPSDVSIYSPATESVFRFHGRLDTPNALRQWPLTESSAQTRGWATRSLQFHFARKIAELALEHQTKLVFLHMPESTEMGSSVIQEPEFRPRELRGDVAMAGIQPSKFFQGMSAEDIRMLYYNDEHLNKNGQTYFTRLVTPALLKLYDAPYRP